MTNSKHMWFMAGISIVALVLSGCGALRSTPAALSPVGNNVTVSTMRITSSAFAHNQMIPFTYTCDGKNINPPLAFSGVPEEARSLVLIVDDPDAPRGTWVHWLVWNIDAAAGGFPEAVDFSTSGWHIQQGTLGQYAPLPPLEGTTSFGTTGYGGPCPPSGTHRYFFKLYALDTVLNLPATADKAQLEGAVDGHALATAELIGLYQRQ